MKYPTSQRPGYRKDKSSGETRQGIHYAGTELGRNRNWSKVDSCKDSVGMATILEQVQDKCYAAISQSIQPMKMQRQDGNSTEPEQSEKPTLNRDAAELNRSDTETKRDTHAADSVFEEEQSWNEFRTETNAKSNLEQSKHLQDEIGITPEQTQNDSNAETSQSTQLTKRQWWMRAGNATWQYPNDSGRKTSRNIERSETKRNMSNSNTELGVKRSWNRMDNYKNSTEMAPKNGQYRNGSNTWNIAGSRNGTIDGTTKRIQSQNTNGRTSRMRKQDVSESRCEAGTQRQKRGRTRMDNDRCKQSRWTTSDAITAAEDTKCRAEKSYSGRGKSRMPETLFQSSLGRANSISI